MIALVVAGTSHTLVTRLPGLQGSGTRVHTIPDALATSTAATRSTSCSYSSSSSSCGSRIAGPSPPITMARCRAARGPRSEAESLTGVLQAQCATRQGQGPGARLTYELTAQRRHRRRRATRPDFHACATPPQGHQDYPELVQDGYQHADWQANPRPHLLVTGMRGYTDSGVIGQPSLATAEKGQAILDSLTRSFKDHLEVLS